MYNTQLCISLWPEEKPDYTGCYMTYATYMLCAFYTMINASKRLHQHQSKHISPNNAKKYYMQVLKITFLTCSSAHWHIYYMFIWRVISLFCQLRQGEIDSGILWDRCWGTAVHKHWRSKTGESRGKNGWVVRFQNSHWMPYCIQWSTRSHGFPYIRQRWNF